MKESESGIPQIGDAARSLGVRKDKDIKVDSNGDVHPGTGGMSVAPDTPTNLPSHRRNTDFGGDRSGSSIKGKNRVSPLANKSVKTLLHLAALAAIKSKGELQDYFLRKVAEGKNKMAVINVIRNKLISRILAVVKQNRKYKKTIPILLVNP